MLLLYFNDKKYVLLSFSVILKDLAPYQFSDCIKFLINYKVLNAMYK
jgi:hypothetical protein